MLKPKFSVFFTLIAVLSIITMAFAGCDIESWDDYVSYVVVNNYDQAITRMTIRFLEPGFNFDYYLFENENYTKGKSKVEYLEKYDKPFNAEVTAWFGSEYDFNDYRFAPGETTVITLNENGILE